MKKNYIKPSLQVVMLNQSDVIATSGSTVSLSFSLDDPEEEGYAD